MTTEQEGDELAWGELNRAEAWGARRRMITLMIAQPSMTDDERVAARRTAAIQSSWMLAVVAYLVSLVIGSAVPFVVDVSDSLTLYYSITFGFVALVSVIAVIRSQMLKRKYDGRSS